MKLVHTPFGFTESEKKNIFKPRDVLMRWKVCVNTSFSKFAQTGSEIPNKKQKIYRLLDSYLKFQANIRNKIAHGQWEYPLFKSNLTHDPEAKLLIDLIDVIQIDIWFDVFKEVAEIVHGLIDARLHNNHLAHYNHYFTRLTNIDSIIEKKKAWTLQDKKQDLN